MLLGRYKEGRFAVDGSFADYVTIVGVSLWCLYCGIRFRGRHLRRSEEEIENVIPLKACYVTEYGKLTPAHCSAPTSSSGSQFAHTRLVSNYRLCRNYLLTYPVNEPEYVSKEVVGTRVVNVRAPSFRAGVLARNRWDRADRGMVMTTISASIELT